MLATIRRFTKTWPARMLFVLLVAAFGLWGVAGKLYNLNSDTAVAHVGDTRIEAAEVQRVYTQQMAQLTRTNGPDFNPPPGERQRMVNEAIRELVLQAALGTELKRLHVLVPDAAVREETFSLAAFKGTDGNFSRQAFQAALARNNLDEATFIRLVRDDLSRAQLIGAIESGATAPNLLVDQVFTFARETRVATAVTLPIAAASGIADPTDAQLQRFWANNPALYATPELRHIKVVVLSPETMASSMPVTDAEIHALYKAMDATYNKPELRSVQVLSATDQAVAARLAAAWRAGADWAAIQAQATAAGATPIDLPNAKRAELPDDALAAAAFTAAPDAVSAPVQGTAGWYVLKVTKITPALSVPFDQARTEVRSRVGVLKAADVLDDRANKLEDALAGGGTLDDLPPNLGLAAAEGTLDASGNTRDGTPAPLPAGPDLRAAIIADAFKTKPGDSPRLEQLPASKLNPTGAYYALTVQSIGKPSQLAYDQVAPKVQLDWTRDQMRHLQETRAASLLATVNAGTPLATAAAAMHLAVQTLPPVPRSTGEAPPPDGVPAQLVGILFTLNKGAATMLTTPDGFMVAQLQSIDVPTPAADPIGVTQLRHVLDRSVAGDMTDLLVSALQQRSKVTVNQRLAQQIAQP